MGNVLCRHKNSPTASASGTNGLANQNSANHTSTSSLRTPFDRIISRVQLCPSSIHNRPDHNKKNCNKCENSKKDYKITKQQIQHTGLNNEKEIKVQNQTTINNDNWQDVKLEAANLQEIKSIFADLINPHTPIPPPRRHRQKLIEQTYNELYSHKEPVYEEPCTKVIKRKHVCKIDEDRFYKQHVKHHSTVSLPNINELQLSVAKEAEDDDIAIQFNEKQRNIEENKKIGRLENYMMRCRSFGSLLPNKLVDKLKLSRRINSETAESDDSWGGLEDWDLGVIEHYKPHDNSLPRPVNKNKINELYKPTVPIPPVRKTDSLLRKHRKDGLDKNMENEQRNSVMKIIDIPTDSLNNEKKSIENFTEGKNNENVKRNSDVRNETKMINNNIENFTDTKNLENVRRNSDLKSNDILNSERINSSDLTFNNENEHKNERNNSYERSDFTSNNENDKKTVDKYNHLQKNFSENEHHENKPNLENITDKSNVVEKDPMNKTIKSVENFKPTICYEEKKHVLNTPPPTPEILIPTVSPTFIDTHSSDHSTLMKLITEITASNDDLSNQNDVDLTKNTEFQQVALSDILETSNNVDKIAKNLTKSNQDDSHEK